MNHDAFFASKPVFFRNLCSKIESNVLCPFYSGFLANKFNKDVKYKRPSDPIFHYEAHALWWKQIERSFIGVAMDR